MPVHKGNHVWNFTHLNTAKKKKNQTDQPKTNDNKNEQNPLKHKKPKPKPCRMLSAKWIVSFEFIFLRKLLSSLDTSFIDLLFAGS